MFKESTLINLRIECTFGIQMCAFIKHMYFGTNGMKSPDGAADKGYESIGQGLIQS